jgi:hypothetical protein
MPPRPSMRAAATAVRPSTLARASIVVSVVLEWFV